MATRLPTNENDVQYFSLAACIVLYTADDSEYSTPNPEGFSQSKLVKSLIFEIRSVFFLSLSLLFPSLLLCRGKITRKNHDKNNNKHMPNDTSS